MPAPALNDIRVSQAVRISPPAYEDRLFAPQPGGLWAFNNSGVPFSVQLGTNLSLSGNVLNAAGGSGSADWGSIGGNIADQVDLQSALALKANISSLATVATTGAYSDLSGLPTLGGAAALNVGTVAGTVAAGNDSRIVNAVPNTRTVNGHALSGDVTISAFDVGLGNVTNDAQVKRTEMGVALGVATLDSGGKIPLSQVPDSILGQVHYKGAWNASTNTPTLAIPPASTTMGDYYVTSVAGTFDSISFDVGDWIISNGAAWQKIDNTDAVVSVAGRIGAVTLFQADISGLTTSDSPTFNSLTLSGSVLGGTWTGSVIGSTYGGTGINNGSRTLTLAGSVTTVGAFTLSLTQTSNTSVTLPVTGTLATLAGTESLTNKKLGSLTGNGFVKTSSGDGTLSVDTNTYLTPTGNGSGLTLVNAVTLLTKTWAIPDPIGSTTPNSGSFTTLGATGAVKFNSSGGTPVAAIGGTVLQVSGAPASDSVIQIDSYSGNPAFVTRRANGTIGSPSALQSGDIIGGIFSGGYGASAFGSQTASYRLVAAENWTNLVQGTLATVNLTTLGSLTSVVAMTITPTLVTLPLDLIVTNGLFIVTSDVVAITTGLSNITGLDTFAVTAGNKYAVHIHLRLLAVNTVGWNFKINGSATFTLDGDGVLVHGPVSSPLTQWAAMAAMNSGPNFASAATEGGFVDMQFTIAVSASGTCTPQFGLNNGTGSATVKAGGTMWAQRIP